MVNRQGREKLTLSVLKDAIYKEFEEWIEVEDDDEDVELLVLEPISEVLDELDED